MDWIWQLTTPFLLLATPCWLAWNGLCRWNGLVVIWFNCYYYDVFNHYHIIVQTVCSGSILHPSLDSTVASHFSMVGLSHHTFRAISTSTRTLQEWTECIVDTTWSKVIDVNVLFDLVSESNLSDIAKQTKQGQQLVQLPPKTKKK